jgi:hypothetical protein
LPFTKTNFWEHYSGIFNPEGMLTTVREFLLKNNNNFEGLFVMNDVLNFSSRQFYSTMQSVSFSIQIMNPNDKYLNMINTTYQIYNNDNTNNLNDTDNHCLKLEVTNNNLVFDTYIGILEMEIQVDSGQLCDYHSEKKNLKVSFKDQISNSSISFNIILEIVPTPHKFSRILIDRYHNLYYPFDGKILTDNLYFHHHRADWTYESIDTNYNKVSYLNFLDVQSF